MPVCCHFRKGFEYLGQVVRNTSFLFSYSRNALVIHRFLSDKRTCMVQKGKTYRENVLAWNAF